MQLGVNFEEGEMTKALFNKVMLAALGLVSMLSGGARADTYTYDTQGRLTSVAYTAGGSVTYTYDDAGNRTAQVKAP